jgi:aminoacrylate hydrolase
MMPMPTARLGDIELYYEQHGNGTPLLLVGGLSGVGAVWKPNIPGFSAHYRVILHDQRGTGQSSRPRMQYSVEQMASDLLHLIDYLGIDKAHLLGHSGGAAIAQTLSITYPERLLSLVLYSGWTKADPYLRRALEIRGTLLSAAGATAFLRSGPVFFYPPDWVNRNIESLQTREEAATTGIGDPHIVASRIDAFLAFDRTADLHRVRTPTLVICARDDILTPPYFSDDLARLIPGSEIVKLDYGGHFASESNQGAFEAAVLTFLAHHTQ